MVRRILTLLACLSIATPTLQQLESNEEFHEELTISTLPNNQVNSYFQFTTRWHYGDRNNLHNTNLVPRAIAEILLKYDLKELHISLTQGLWRYESWGYPVVDAAPGSEVWAWFSSANLTDIEVDEQWVKLANVFSGILCASLNFIDKTNTISPSAGFRPQFVAANKEHPKFVRYSSLPREIVCTENLTPWKKLLPCDSNKGFASLLNSGFVHNTNYHSLGIKVRTICDNSAGGENCILEFTESANLVHDTKLVGSSNDFSLRRLFGQGLNGYCVLAKTSKIHVRLNENDNSYELNPLPKYNVTSYRGGSTTVYGVYDMQSLVEDKLFNIAWIQKKEKQTITIPMLPPIYAHRHIFGRGQEKGSIVTNIVNNYYGALHIVLQENIPWFVPSYMHTLKITLMTASGKQEEIEPKFVYYIPGVQRTRPYHLEMGIEIPAKSTIQVSFEFDYIFLKWLEYPPDANHGHYLGSAVISTQLPVARNYTSVPVEGFLFVHSFNASRPSYFLQLRTESLILSLPTPDFSMPYNVICLACTVVALAFGPIHSVATKRIVVEQRDSTPQSIFGKIKHRFFKKKTLPVSDEFELIKGNKASDNQSAVDESRHQKLE